MARQYMTTAFINEGNVNREYQLGEWYVNERITTAYTTSGNPANGTVGQASAAVTVTLDAGTFSGTDTITITSNDAADTLTPSVGSPDTGDVTVTPVLGASNFTFTITR